MRQVDLWEVDEMVVAACRAVDRPLSVGVACKVRGVCVVNRKREDKAACTLRTSGIVLPLCLAAPGAIFCQKYQSCGRLLREAPDGQLALVLADTFRCDGACCVPNFNRSRAVDRVARVLSQVVLKDDPLALSTGYQLVVPTGEHDKLGKRSGGSVLIFQSLVRMLEKSREAILVEPGGVEPPTS